MCTLGGKKKKNEELCLKHRKVIRHDRCSELPRAVSQREVSNLPKITIDTLLRKIRIMGMRAKPRGQNNDYIDKSRKRGTYK